MSREPQVFYFKLGDARCNQERESCSIANTVMELPGPQDGSVAIITVSSQAQEATCLRQEGGTGERAASEDVEEGLCIHHRTQNASPDPQDVSATRNVQKRTPQGCLDERIRSHPVLTHTALIVLLFLVLVLAFVMSFSAVSGRMHTLLLACPDDWVGYRRICYFLSRDHLAWDQAKARCFELGASLAALNDKEMEFLFRLSRNNSHWLGLHRQGQRLQWVDGSNFNSSVPLLGNAGCVFLTDNSLRSGSCSNEMQYICSRPQTRL